MIRLLLPLVLALCLALPGLAQTLPEILSAERAKIEKPSRQTIGPVIESIAAMGDPAAAVMLQAWADRGLGMRKADGALFLIARADAGWALTGLDGQAAGQAAKIIEASGKETDAGCTSSMGTAGSHHHRTDHIKDAHGMYPLLETCSKTLLGPLWHWR